MKSVPEGRWGRERKMMRMRPRSRSKSGGVKEGGDWDILYETVIIENYPTEIFIFLRTHVPLLTGNSRFPARPKRREYPSWSGTDGRESDTDDNNSVYNE